LEAREGAKIVIADGGEAAGGKTASKMQANGSPTIFVNPDVSSEGESAEAIEKVVTRFGRLDIRSRIRRSADSWQARQDSGVQSRRSDMGRRRENRASRA